MKIRIFIIVTALIMLALGAWYFFSRPEGSSFTETINDGLPFGMGGGDINNPASGSTDNSNSDPKTSNIPRSHLFQISDVPVAGAVSFVKNGAEVVRYVERGTGHIVDIDPVSLAKVKIVNNTTPKIYDALFKKDGSSVIFRTIRSDGEIMDSSSIALTPPAGTSTSDVYTTKITGLPANISEVSVGQKNIFYNIKNLPQINVSLFDGSKPSTLWSLSFSQWRLNAAGDTSLIITSKATSDTDGYSYKVGVAGGTPTKVLGPYKGLITNPDSALKRIAYSYKNGTATTLVSKDIAKDTLYSIRPATFAEKCVWSPTSKYGTIYCAIPIQNIQKNEPEMWYQGITHYSDRLWRFDVDNDFSQAITDPKKEFNLDIDAQKLFLSPNEDYLFFQNRNDLTLWALKLD